MTSDYLIKLEDFEKSLTTIRAQDDLLRSYSAFVSEYDDKEYLENPLVYLSTAQPLSSRQIRNLKERMIIHLRQYVDYNWYKNHQQFKNDSDILVDELAIDLGELKKNYKLQFQYRPLKKGPIGRHRNAVRKRLDTINRNPGASTIGMRTVCSRLEVMALINEISKKVSNQYKDKLQLQINSIIRTIAHQQELINIGYNATQFSSHCVGYAIDIERRWYAIHNKELFHCINNVLIDYHNKGIINLIDERIVWHICLNPEYIQTYKDKAGQWLK